MTDVQAPEPLPFDEFQVGDLVEHPTWGVGSILHRSGRGENTKLVATFPEIEGNGQKKLKAAFAKLKKLEDKKDEGEEESGTPAAPADETAKDEEIKAKTADGEESEEDDDDDDDEVFDEKAAASALNIEDEEEEVAASANTSNDDDWGEEAEK